MTTNGPHVCELAIIRTYQGQCLDILLDKNFKMCSLLDGFNGVIFFALSKNSESALIRGCEIFPYFFPSVLGWRYALIDLTLNLRCEKD